MSLSSYVKKWLQTAGEPIVKLEKNVNLKNEDKQMLDKIMAAFKNGADVTHMTSFMNAVNQVMAHFQADYVKDGNARDAAIDALVELLQNQKGSPQA